MKPRYWLSSLLLLAAGIFFYFCVYAYQFTGLFLCLLAAGVFLFGLVDSLKKKWPRGMKLLHRAMCALVCLGVVAMLVTGCFIGSAADGDTETEADYVIVLGAGVNGTVPSQSLRERLLALEDYLAQHPNTIAILSGGRGDREHITEAECMYRWLTERGMDPERLWKEERSTDTEENIRFSLDLIEEKTGARPTRAAVVSSEYHLYRAGYLAQQEGLEILGVPAETTVKPYFCNMFVREIFAVWLAWIF
ncbi:MAG: YdcF family protein [Oscillospiraceae bacterium]|nr:YdcF family protein [Oscillospiraceae bacterium]